MNFNFKKLLVKLGGGVSADAYVLVKEENDKLKKDCDTLATKNSELVEENNETKVENSHLKEDIENYKKANHFELKDNIVIRHKVTTMKKDIITYCAYNDDGRNLYSKVNFAFQRYDNKIAYSFDFNSWNLYRVNGTDFEFGKAKSMAEYINELIKAKKDILIEEIR